MAALAAAMRAARPPGAPDRSSRWPRPPEKRGWSRLDVLAACHHLGACCVDPTHSLQSGRSAPTLDPFRCSLASVEPTCPAVALESTIGHFGDCQSVRRPPRGAVGLTSRHGSREMCRALKHDQEWVRPVNFACKLCFGKCDAGPAAAVDHPSLLAIYSSL